MKNLCYVIVVIGLCLSTNYTLKAQTTIAKIYKPIKFIEHIEITPQAYPIKKTSATTLPTQANNINKDQTEALLQKKISNVQIEQCTALQFKYAMLMDIAVEKVENITLYNAIETWWATKYRYGGTTKSGIDCSAFCNKIFEAVYTTTLPRTAREQYALCSKIAKVDLQEGDLVFFNTRGGVSHVGIYLGNDCFVHSSVHSGVTINKLTDDYYGKKFISGGRLN